MSDTKDDEWLCKCEKYHRGFPYKCIVEKQIKWYDNTRLQSFVLTIVFLLTFVINFRKYLFH